MNQLIKTIAEQTPITTLNMDYVAVYSNDRWVIKDKKGATVASSCDSDNITKFIAPFFWQDSQTYQVELNFTDGCTNSQCNWTCNGCTAKGRVLDITNNMVTILKYL